MAAGFDVEKITVQMGQASVREPPIYLAEKVPPGTRKFESLDVVTNVLGLIPQKNIPVYRYDFCVLEEFPPKKGSTEPFFKEVSKQTKNDYLTVDRKTKCLLVYQALLKREKQFFGNMDSLIYDRASILYSLRKLPMPKASDEQRVTFFVMPDELPVNIVCEDCIKIHTHVKPCKEDFQLTMSDLKSCVSNNLDNINRSLQQFLEILVMQEVFFMEGRFVSYGTGECYLMDPNQFGFGDRDAPLLEEGKYVAIGAAKGVRIIEGPRGFKEGINAALVFDVKKAAFHIDNQNLLEKVEHILRKGRVDLTRGIGQQSITVLNNALKGLYVRCDYGKRRAFIIAGVSKENARTSKLVTKDGEMTIEKYFETKYSMKLKYPTLPLIMEKCQPKSNFYPIEVLSVCENQRVSKGQQTSSQVQTMIRACATLPSIRLQQTNVLSKAMKLDNSNRNKWMDKCNVTVTSNLEFKARVLPMPAIEYRTNGWVKPCEKTSWTDGRNQYLIPAVCKNWCAVALMGQREGRFNEHQFRNYIQIFLKHCRRHGMEMGDPLVLEYIHRSKQQDIESLVLKAKRLGATFIHFVTADELSYHAHMKYIESQEQIVTQDLKASTAIAVAMQNKAQTLDNIVNKTNIKMGGLNYSVHLETDCDGWLMKTGLLIVGLDIAHPVWMSSRKDQNGVPSVVGYSANIKKHPLDFIGGYRYGKANAEEMVDDTIQHIFADVLQYFNANRGKPPVHLFVIRDGISVGQYKYVMKYEVENIKKACQMVGGPGFRPHITFIVLTKMHRLRIYKKNIRKQDRGAEQNIKPGTVIDEYVVDPTINEFYLNSHSAFQGTTKTPRYTLLFDTSGMKADVMQGIVYALAYDFQIVNMAVSRPSPVMIASRMAKRGRSNYMAMYGDDSENSDNGNGIEKDLVELNNRLSYISKPLEVVRFNA